MTRLVLSGEHPNDSVHHSVYTPSQDGLCRARTIVLSDADGRSCTVKIAWISDDRSVLDTIDFRPHFSETDAPLKAFAAVVNALGSW